MIFKLDKSQRKELSKYWFDISKLLLASLVIKLFEQGAPAATFGSLLIALSALTSSVLVAMLGLHFAKE